MAKKKTTEKSTSGRALVIRLLIIALVLFVFIKAVQLYSQLQQKERVLSDLDGRIQTQLVVNEGLTDQAEHADDYLEHKANENGYYAPGQQIYQNEAG